MCRYCSGGDTTRELSRGSNGLPSMSKEPPDEDESPFKAQPDRRGRLTGDNENNWPVEKNILALARFRRVDEHDALLRALRWTRVSEQCFPRRSASHSCKGLTRNPRRYSHFLSYQFFPFLFLAPRHTLVQHRPVSSGIICRARIKSRFSRVQERTGIPDPGAMCDRDLTTTE